MDQMKTGRFIGSLRKEKKLTQAELADQLGISDKTVSKWERGAGSPDVSLMLPLCGALGISVNELLTGERLTPDTYRSKAEENMMDLVKENSENKAKMVQATLCGIITIIAVCALILIASLIEMPAVIRVAVVVLAVLVAVMGIGTAASLDRKAGYFECPSCKTMFIPTAKDYVKAYHTMTKRRLTCPQCGKTGMCKHKVVR